MTEEENETEIKDPFRNNSYEGKRKRNFSFKLTGGKRKKQ